MQQETWFWVALGEFFWAVAATVIAFQFHRMVQRLSFDPNTGFLRQGGYNAHLSALAMFVARAKQAKRFMQRPIPWFHWKWFSRFQGSVWLIRYDVSALTFANSFGHENGDRYLKLCADAIFDAMDTLGIKRRKRYWHWLGYSGAYRIGGDEYAVVLVGLSEEELHQFLDHVEDYLEDVDPDEIGMTPEMCGGFMSIEGAVELYDEFYSKATAPKYARNAVTALIGLWDSFADVTGLAEKFCSRLAFFAAIWVPEGHEDRPHYEMRRIPDMMKAITGFDERKLDELCEELRGLGWEYGESEWRDNPVLKQRVQEALMTSVRRQIELAQADIDSIARKRKGRMKKFVLERAFGEQLKAVKAA